MAPDGPSERMRKTLKSPYDEDGDFWTALFNAFSDEFAEYEDALEQVETNKFVDTANPGSLERLATIFDIQRETTESVPEFRARLKTALRSQITSATVSEIQAVTAVILGADRSEINIIEPSEFSPAFIELDLPDVLDELDANRVIEIVELVTAAGVEVGIRVITESESVFLLEDDFEVGPFAENELPEGVAIVDESQVEPFTELLKQGVMSLGDAEQTEPFDGMYREDVVSLGDTGRNRTDASVEAYWNEGIWSINFWHTFETLPDEVFENTVGVSDAEQTEPFDGLYRPDTHAVGDGFETGPLGGANIAEVVGLLDTGRVGPTGGLDISEVLGVVDTAQVGPTGGLDQSDSLTVADESRNRTDADEEEYWNDGKWGINFWHTFEVLPDEEFADEVAIRDVGFTVKRDSVGEETVLFSDTGAVVERDSEAFDTVAVTDDGRVLERDSVGEERFRVRDEAEFDPVPEEERAVPEDTVVLTPHETTDNVWDEGKWGFDVWHTFSDAPDETHADEQAVRDEVTLTPQPTAEYYWDEGVWGFGVWTTD